jgi:biotin carboxyl carrier protein
VDHEFAGEILDSRDRLVVSPACGVFRAAAHLEACGRAWLERGDVLGTIDVYRSDGAVVVSPFRGSLCALLACTGERVRVGQPLAWLHDE